MGEGPEQACEELGRRLASLKEAYSFQNPRRYNQSLTKTPGILSPITATWPCARGVSCTDRNRDYTGLLTAASDTNAGIMAQHLWVLALLLGLVSISLKCVSCNTMEEPISRPVQQIHLGPGPLLTTPPFRLTWKESPPDQGLHPTLLKSS